MGEHILKHFPDCHMILRKLYRNDQISLVPYYQMIEVASQAFPQTHCGDSWQLLSITHPGDPLVYL